MKIHILTLALLLFSGLAFGQCTANPAGGTSCVGPLSTSTPGVPYSLWELTPVATGTVCPPGIAASVGKYIFCGQDHSILVDTGDGLGYNSLKGKDGTNGINGVTPTVVVNSTTTGNPGTPAAVTNSGDSLNVKLDFVIPAPTNGVNGISPNVTIGTVTTLAPGLPATVTNTGVFPVVKLNFGIPQGQPGTIKTSFTCTLTSLIGTTISFTNCK